jgi:hypothetical protein
MKKKVFLSITFLLLSFLVAFGGFKEAEKNLERLLSDYQSSPTRTLTTLLEYDNFNVDIYQQFWAKVYKLRRLSKPKYSRAKYNSDLPFKLSDEFNYKILDLIRFTGDEIEFLLSEIICNLKNVEENNKVFARMDLLLELLKKYYRRMNGIRNRDRAKIKIERLSFVLDSIKSNLNYHDQEANYRFLLSVYDEVKFNYAGSTPLLKQRVGNLFSLFKNLMKILSSSQFHRHNSPFEVVFLGRKLYFKWLFIQKEPRQEVLHAYYKNFVWNYSVFIKDFKFLLGREKNAKELDANYLIKIYFFSRLAEYIEEKASDPYFIPNLKYATLVGPDCVSHYKDLGRLELYLRKFFNEAKQENKPQNN